MRHLWVAHLRDLFGIAWHCIVRLLCLSDHFWVLVCHVRLLVARLLMVRLFMDWVLVNTRWILVWLLLETSLFVLLDLVSRVWLIMVDTLYHLLDRCLLNAK